MDYGIIYLTTNLINGKEYVGQTRQSFRRRINGHKNKKDIGMPICNAIYKYGMENFVFEVLYYCINQKEMDKMERYYVDLYDTWRPNGYNLRAGNGRGSVSEETRRRMSLSAKNKVVSNATREKQSKMRTEKPTKVTTHYFISPNREEIKVINLQKFCRENNLSRECMRDLTTARQWTYKGWKIDRTHYPNLPEQKIKERYFISPEGEHTTITNVQEFCRQNNLASSCMFAILSGKSFNHRGWTLDKSKYNATK